MPPPVKRDDTVFVFDCNVAAAFFTKAKECLLDIFGSKWCSDSKNSVCLLPFGASNHTVEEFYDYNPSLVIDTITDIEKNDGRIFRKLLRAVEILEARHKTMNKGLVTLQLVVISDFSNTKCDDDAEMELIATKLNRIDAFLYVLGPEVIQNEMLIEWRDLYKWIKNPHFVDENNENLKPVKRLLQAVKHCAACGLKMGPLVINVYKKWAGPQPCLLPLTIGDRISFTNRDVRRLKKLSFMKIETSCSENVLRQTYVLAENPEVEVEFENMVRAICVDGKWITMPQEVRDSFKVNGERFFDILGFVKRSEIPSHLFVGDGTHRTAPFGIYANWTVGLIRVLREKEMVGIAAKRVIRNTRVKFWALIPSDNGRYFHVQQLPYGNHLRKPYIETPIEDQLSKLDDDEKNHPSPMIDKDHEVGIYNYLDSMELTINELPLNVSMMSNPQFKRWWRLAIKNSTGVEMDWREELILGKTAPSLLDPIVSFWPKRKFNEPDN